MNLKATIRLVLCVAIVIFSSSASSASLEDQYFTVRDSYIQSFSDIDSPNDAEDRRVRADLDRLIKKIVGPVRVKGFNGEGSINLETLQPELGFGRLDGVLFSSEKEDLVVTTQRIFDHYVYENKDLPKNLAALSKVEHFYTAAISSDAAVSLYATIAVPASSKGYVAYAHLGLYAQDIGPWLPNRIFILAKKGERVFMVSAVTVSQAPEIAACKNSWSRADEKDEEAAYSAYKVCYGKQIQASTFYASVSKQAGDIVKRIYE